MFNCVLTERVERLLVLNKTDLEWCTRTENDKKLRKIRGRSRGGAGRGVDWVASHPPLEQLTKKIYQNIIRGKTYQNTWLPKKSRRLSVTISFLDVICSGKEGSLQDLRSYSSSNHL